MQIQFCVYAQMCVQVVSTCEWFDLHVYVYSRMYIYLQLGRRLLCLRVYLGLIITFVYVFMWAFFQFILWVKEQYDFGFCFLYFNLFKTGISRILQFNSYSLNITNYLPTITLYFVGSLVMLAFQAMRKQTVQPNHRWILTNPNLKYLILILNL